MKRKGSYSPDIPPTKRQIVLTPILALSQELIFAVTSFKEKGFELAIAMTCKLLYDRYEQYYEEQTAVVLYNSQDNVLHNNSSIKALQHRNDWIRFKFIPTSNFQRNSPPIKALCLSKELKVPENLNCEDLNALIVASSSPTKFTANIHFFGRFPNLKSLELKSFYFGKHIVSIFSKIILLEFIYLSFCDATECDPSKMFANCLSLQEIHLTGFKYRYEVPLSLPAPLKRLEMQKCHEPFEVDASRCIQLKSL